MLKGNVIQLQVSSLRSLQKCIWNYIFRRQGWPCAESIITDRSWHPVKLQTADFLEIIKHSSYYINCRNNDTLIRNHKHILWDPWETVELGLFVLFYPFLLKITYLHVHCGWWAQGHWGQRTNTGASLLWPLNAWWWRPTHPDCRTLLTGLARL